MVTRGCCSPLGLGRCELDSVPWALPRAIEFGPFGAGRELPVRSQYAIGFG
jgi:hypothetical protein